MKNNIKALKTFASLQELVTSGTTHISVLLVVAVERTEDGGVTAPLCPVSVPWVDREGLQVDN